MMDDHILSGSHACTQSLYGDWRLTERSPFLEEEIIIMQEIKHLLTDDKLKTVKFLEIAWKGMHFPVDERRDKCICCGGRRYFSCNTNYPPVLCIHTSNPYNKKYRMIDGKHRMEKMVAQGLVSSKFYVLTFEDIEPFTKLKNPNGIHRRKHRETFR